MNFKQFLNEEESNKHNICIDLDGTITTYKHWVGEDHFDPPQEGVQEAIKSLQEAGFYITVFTTRGNTDKVANYLEENNIPYNEINHYKYQPDGCNPGKPIADFYIDDKAIRFQNWKQVLSDIKRIKSEGSINNEESLIGKHNGTEKDVDPEQLELGIRIEMEHTNDKSVAKAIALDHLNEISDYYSRLIKMGKEAKDEL